MYTCVGCLYICKYVVVRLGLDLIMILNYYSYVEIEKGLRDYYVIIIFGLIGPGKL